MRAIWKGSITFGLVTIPVAMHTATRRDELGFRMLRKSDLSPINYKRVAEVDGKEVPWEEIVKGYEYEKDRFVTVTDEDFDRVDLKSTDTIEIVDFVEVEEIDPMYFDKPYYLEPQKGGAGAYAVLRDVLEKTKKVGIAKVIIRTRQHLAAVKPYDKLLVAELMHFADELIAPEGLKVPAEKKLGQREEQMATMLVDQMTSKWKPEEYVDEYKDALMKVIEKKVAAGGKELPTEKHKALRATNVIDLVEVLKKSLSETTHGGGEKKTAVKKKHAPATKRRAAHHKKAA